jgi:hypothetical protein
MLISVRSNLEQIAAFAKLALDVPDAQLGFVRVKTNLLDYAVHRSQVVQASVFAPVLDLSHVVARAKRQRNEDELL